MSLKTTNAYGRISVTDEAIAQVAGYSALECYGIVDLVSKRLIDAVLEIFRKKKLSRGIVIETRGDRIFVVINVVMKYGVSIEAVAESLKKSVRYDIEKFTGMIVGSIKVNVVGIHV